MMKTIVHGDGWESVDLAIAGGPFAYAGPLKMQFRDPVKVLQGHYSEGEDNSGFFRTPVVHCVREPDPNLPMQNGKQGQANVRAYGHPMSGT